MTRVPVVGLVGGALFVRIPVGRGSRRLRGSGGERSAAPTWAGCSGSAGRGRAGHGGEPRSGAPDGSVITVDGRSVAETGFGPAIQAIRGEEGTSVQLSVRAGDGVRLVVVPRRRIRAG